MGQKKHSKWGHEMGLQWGTTKKHTAIGKKVNNVIVIRPDVVSGVDIY